MRIVLFFDQIQSGTGGKEGANVELALEKGGMGSYMMFSEYIKNSRWNCTCHYILQ